MLTEQDVLVMQRYFDAIEDTAVAMGKRADWRRAGRKGKGPPCPFKILDEALIHAEGRDAFTYDERGEPHGGTLWHRCMSLAHQVANERGLLPRVGYRLKLDPELVLAIYEMAHSGKHGQEEIAFRFEVSQKVVSDIKLGRAHSAVTGHERTRPKPRARLTEQDARAIYIEAHQPESSQREIAKRYGICKKTVSAIKHRRTWRRETEDLAMKWAS